MQMILEDIWKYCDVHNHEILKLYFGDIAHQHPIEDDLFKKFKKIRVMTDEDLKSNMQDDGVFLMQ
ncbi:hypothetical protein [Bacillus cereus]|uniref:hypothetical protein n=1 Tax=Bacillus cereus TaxID=1396 RepID=UPI001596F48E|nr:hypothetical protein [Bacillus cereus]